MPGGGGGGGAVASWRLIPRPLMETVVNNHALHHRVPRALLLHGPRGVGKTSILRRLLPEWDKPPHYAAFVDFAADTSPPPWAFGRSSGVADIADLRCRLEGALEGLARRAVLAGAVGSKDVLSALSKWHGLRTALTRLVGPGRIGKRDSPVSALWAKAVLTVSACDDEDAIVGAASDFKDCSIEDRAYMLEAAAALRLAKEVLRMQEGWRKEAVRAMNRARGFSRPLANSATDWPCLLLEILSGAAEVDFFQPKLILNNVDVLRKAACKDKSMVPAGMYHDSFIWRVIALGVNERCLPVILATSDGYYSYQAFMDFGFPDVFISRETFGWTSQEAKLHMVSEFFNEEEWKVVDEVLGPNPRQLSELYMLKQNANSTGVLFDNGNIEDIVETYLAYLQVAVVNPAMETALNMLQKFASDVREGKIPESRLSFGSPWRHPPWDDSPAASYKWAKIQLMDFVQSFTNTEFGVNYLADYTLEIFDDPAAVAMLEVGLLYQQRDPSFVRPITRGIQRCLVRWLVQQRMQLNLQESIAFVWQRVIRGRSYRHLMKEVSPAEDIVTTSDATGVTSSFPVLVSQLTINFNGQTFTAFYRSWMHALIALPTQIDLVVRGLFLWMNNFVLDQSDRASCNFSFI